MKSILATLFAIGILVTVCNAACSRHPAPKKSFWEDPVKGCIYRDKLHPLNSRWRIDCIDCSCGRRGDMECCDNAGTVVEYDKENCVPVLDKENCVWSVKQKEGHSKPCTYYSVVG